MRISAYILLALSLVACDADTDPDSLLESSGADSLSDLTENAETALPINLAPNGTSTEQEPSGGEVAGGEVATEEGGETATEEGGEGTSQEGGETATEEGGESTTEGGGQEGGGEGTSQEGGGEGTSQEGGESVGQEGGGEGNSAECIAAGTGTTEGSICKNIAWKDSNDEWLELHSFCGNKLTVLVETADW